MGRVFTLKRLQKGCKTLQNIWLFRRNKIIAGRISLSGFDYDTRRNAKERAVKQFLHIWAHAIDGLVRLDHQRRHPGTYTRNWSLAPPGRSCNATMQRRWAAGEQIVR